MRRFRSNPASSIFRLEFAVLKTLHFLSPCPCSHLPFKKNYRENNGGQSSSTYTQSREEDSQDSLGVLSSPSSTYYVQAFLGEGCFGQVVKCLKASTGEMVAVKMIKETSMTPEAHNEVAFTRDLCTFTTSSMDLVLSSLSCTVWLSPDGHAGVPEKV